MSLAAQLEQIKKMSPAEKEALLKQSSEVLKHTRWIPAPGPQTQAYDCKADILLYGGEAGGGKGLIKQQLILTPFGWKRIGELSVGSPICGTDGTVQRIIGYYERGIQPLYKLKWSDGSETICDSDHIWLAWRGRTSRKINNIPVCGQAAASKWTTSQIYELYKKGRKTSHRLAIPLISKPCAFNVHGENKGKSKHISRSVPAYVLGVLLGDGCITGNSVMFCSADKEIPERVEHLLCGVYGDSFRMSEYKTKGICSSYRIPSEYLKSHLTDLGLMGHGAASKFIPRIYLFATVEERWELLRGLMDTDGWADKDGDSYFCSVSLKLAEDVRHLARSLGAFVTWRENTPKFTGRDGKKKCGRRAYTLRIKMPEPERMFNLRRKADTCRGKTPQSMGLWLDDIQPHGRAETVCIAVSNANSLFVIEDFIVTHNSDLLLGLALSQHKRSLIMRREYTDLGALTERAIAIHGSKKGFNGSSPPKLNTNDGRRIDFGAAKNLGDEAAWMGREHSLLGFDEAAQFAESQIRFLFTWVRTSVPGERTRIILATNPPITAEGEWLIAFFAPWLDPGHRNPAKPGELRWFIAPDAGKDIEVSDGKPFFHEGKEYIPMSRTFIPAKVSDNPYYSGSEYRAKLDSLPEPYRSAYRDGNFMIGRKDAERQCIPSAWVRDAQARWTPRPPEGVPMCTIAGDPAMGGQDDTVLGTRYDSWFSEMIATPGINTPTGSELAGLIVQQRRHGAEVVLDFGGGYGSAPAMRLKDNDIIVTAHKGAEKSNARTADGKFKFVNKRSEVIWKLREALDPTQDGGSPIQLPPDAQLFGDLTAPTFEITANGIKVETKDDVKKKLGRSPGKGDVAAMLWSTGQKLATNYDTWKKTTAANTTPKVVMGRPAVIRRKPF